MTVITGGERPKMPESACARICMREGRREVGGFGLSVTMSGGVAVSLPLFFYSLFRKVKVIYTRKSVISNH
jgi:hypothetical protein